MDPEKSLPDEYEMCCGKSKCPSVKLENESVLISAPNDEVEGGPSRAGIRLTAEQATEMRRWLQQKGF